MTTQWKRHRSTESLVDEEVSVELAVRISLQGYLSKRKKAIKRKEYSHSVYSFESLRIYSLDLLFCFSRSTYVDH